MVLAGLPKVPLELDNYGRAERLDSGRETLGTPKFASTGGHGSGGVWVLVEQLMNLFLRTIEFYLFLVPDSMTWNQVNGERPWVEGLIPQSVN